MNELQIFRNSEFGELSILELNGKMYFPATACAKILGYTKPHNAILQHCRYSLKQGVPHPQNPSKIIDMNFIPEGDLYRLIVSSKLPSAEKFERWVFDEVLPTIRQTGSYNTSFDSLLLIQKTATAVAAEIVKQFIPAIQEMVIGKAQLNSYNADNIRRADEQIKWRRKPPSIISKLDVEIRRNVDDMLCSRKYTYSDVVKYLKNEGVPITISSVGRYSQSENFCNE